MFKINNLIFAWLEKNVGSGGKKHRTPPPKS